MKLPNHVFWNATYPLFQIWSAMYHTYYFIVFNQICVLLKIEISLSTNLSIILINMLNYLWKRSLEYFELNYQMQGIVPLCDDIYWATLLTFRTCFSVLLTDACSNISKHLERKKLQFVFLLSTSPAIGLYNVHTNTLCGIKSYK